MSTQRLFSPLLLALAMYFSGLSVQAQSPAPKADQDILRLISSFEKTGCSVLEVSDEMFKILAKDERSTEDIKETLSQIDHLIFLNCFGMVKGEKQADFNLTRAFKAKAGDYGFKLLMRSDDSLTSNYFYKRENSDNNEYLLVTKITIQYISTKLNIISIRDLKDIMDLAGDAGDL